MFLHVAQHGVEGAALRPGHIFCAEDRAVVAAQVLHALAGTIERIVAVVRNHIGLVDLHPLGGGQLAILGPLADPHARGDRLGGVGFPRPAHRLGEQFQGALHLARWLLLEPVLAVAVVVLVVGLVPDIPAVHAGVVLETADHAAGVFLQHRVALGVNEVARTGGLHPARVVHARLGIALLAQHGVGIPAAVEQDEQDANLVFGGDGQELVHPLEKARGVLLVGQVVQEDPHAVEAQVARPAEFAVDGGGIESLGLPHFQLVDGIVGQVIGAGHPAAVLPPFLGFFRRPAIASRGQGCSQKGQATSKQ